PRRSARPERCAGAAIPDLAGRSLAAPARADRTTAAQRLRAGAGGRCAMPARPLGRAAGPARPPAGGGRRRGLSSDVPEGLDACAELVQPRREVLVAAVDHV